MTPKRTLLWKEKSPTEPEVNRLFSYKSRKPLNHLPLSLLPKAKSNLTLTSAGASPFPDLAKAGNWAMRYRKSEV